MADPVMKSALLLAVAIPNNINTPQFGEDLYHNRHVLWSKRHATKRDKDSDETGAYKTKFKSKKLGDNFQVHFGWTAARENSNNAKQFHLAHKVNGAFVPIPSGSDLTKMEVKRLPLPYYRAATTDERTRPIIDQIVGRVAPHVQALIEDHFPDVYAKMRNNAKDFRYPSGSIFTSGTISFMFAKNTGQSVGSHMDEKDAKGTVGVSINEIVGTVEGGNLVIDIPGH